LGNGGKMDLFITGTSGTALFKNTSNITPTAPATPTGLTVTLGTENEVTISWAANSTLTTRYNVWLSKPETQYKNFVISQIPIDGATGQPKVSLDHAPLLSTNSYTLKGIPGGEYTVGVQAIGINGKVSALTTTTATVGGGGGTAAPKQTLGNVSAYKNGSVLVVTTDIAAEAELTVYNLNGTKLWTKAGVFAGDTEIGGLPQGAVYLVVIRVGNAQEVRKVLL
jgi:predicted phage tail protein